MERVKNLNRYQKSILIVMAVMALIFAVIYIKTISKVGYRYNDEILVPMQENGKTIYQGKIRGEQAQFTVSEDNSIVFHHGNKTYGTYRMKEDPTAIPEDHEQSEQMIGVEIYKNSELFFRGGIWDSGDFCWLYNEDGTLDNLGVSAYTSYGVEYDENGNVVDRMEPSALNIYELVKGPKLTHKGVMQAWFMGGFVCIFNVLLILFEDELFRWNLAFQIRNVENVEPSDWQIAERYIGWTGMVIIAMLIFSMGLQ